MEFLRFGSSIPGTYWGCCAVDVIQNFKVDPDAKSSIQLVSGDGGGPVPSPNFCGPTYKDIFLQRIRCGTFDKRDMPNHAFIAVLTDWQVKSGVGLKWLKILRETGFEFVRTVANSVYTGQTLAPHGTTGESNQNYIFMLARNIGQGAILDPFTPPKEWSNLPPVTIELWNEAHLSPEDSKALAKKQADEQTQIWNRIGTPKFFTEDEVEKLGAPVVYAGLRSKYPQQTKTARVEAKTLELSKTGPKTSAFPTKDDLTEPVELEDPYEDDEEDYSAEEDSDCGDITCTICNPQ